jgi:hypothetical protein
MRLSIVVTCIILGCLLYWVIRPSNTYKLAFGTKNLYFIKQSWLKNEEFKIEFKNRKWGWHRNGFWTEIAIPYESPINDYYNIVLDRNGKIYMVSKDKLEQHEVRYLDGEWHYQDTATGEWLEFPDYPD